jgi:hypothetical protein
MRDDDRGGGVSDPTVDRLLEWRKDPSALATIALCEELLTHSTAQGAARPSKTLVGFVAKVVANRHWGDPGVVRALAKLQVAAGLLAQSRMSFVRAARLEYLSKPGTARPEPPPPASSRTMARIEGPRIEAPTPMDAETSDHSPPQFLLDLLRGIDDDEAIATVAESQRPPQPSDPNRTRSVDRIAALNATPIGGGTVPFLEAPRRTDQGGLRGPEAHSSDPVP